MNMKTNAIAQMLEMGEEFETLIAKTIGQTKMLHSETGEEKTLNEWKAIFTEEGKSFSMAIADGTLQ